MSGGNRPIHACPYCGRTKFADETLFCCVDDEYERLPPESKAQVDSAMRSYERRCRKERTELVNVPGEKMMQDLTEWSGQ